MNQELQMKDQEKQAQWRQKVNDASNKAETIWLQWEMEQARQEQQQFTKAQKQDYGSKLGYQAQVN